MKINLAETFVSYLKYQRECCVNSIPTKHPHGRKDGNTHILEIKSMDKHSLKHLHS